MNTRTIVASLAIIILSIGCSKDSSSPLNSSPTSSVTVSPNDGASGVRLDAGVMLTFAVPIDRAVVERNVHLISERAMADSLCPISDSMGHGVMEMAMMDSTKMAHLMNRHATPGRFSWTDDNRRCTFKPDSMMQPNTRYMIHMGQEMLNMTNDHMNAMGRMGGHGNGTMNDEMIYHFWTMDTSNVGSGHGAHH